MITNDDHDDHTMPGLNHISRMELEPDSYLRQQSLKSVTNGEKDHVLEQALADLEEDIN